MELAYTGRGTKGCKKGNVVITVEHNDKTEQSIADNLLQNAEYICLSEN